MALGKPSALSIGAVIALVLIVGYLIWSSTNKSDNESYTKGASKTETSVTVAPNEYQLVRCGQLFSVDPKWLAEQSKVKK
jgi:hypothetical protein